MLLLWVMERNISTLTKKNEGEGIMQQVRIQSTAVVQEYIGFQSRTVLCRRCSSGHKANTFVAIVKRETGLKNFHWEEERANGHCRFFVDRFCSEAGFEHICRVALEYRYLLD
jgi:hypothetical protein